MAAKIKIGDRVSKQEMRRQGWGYIITSHGYKVFEKGNQRLLWDLETQKVTHMYMYSSSVSFQSIKGEETKKGG